MSIKNAVKRSISVQHVLNNILDLNKEFNYDFRDKINITKEKYF